jgi:hypothetical protein
LRPLQERITRIKAIKDVLKNKIMKLKDENPHWKVGIVAFNDAVSIIGDGTH